MHASRNVLALCAALCAGCGTAENGAYRGPALATVHGTLSGFDARWSAAPIRLAILWYTVQDPFSGANPPAIVSMDVPYQGTFPVSYAFSLYEPPPDAALTSFSYAGESIRTATGIVAAYQDDNHNGALDLIGDGQSAADTLLGVSMPANGNPHSEDALTLVYYDRAVSQTESLAASAPGYHLRRAGLEVPLSSATDVRLTRAPELNLFACPALYALPQPARAPSGACGMQPALPLLEVVGVAGNPASYFSVTRGVLPAANALFQVDGQPLDWDPSLNLFTASALSAGSHSFVATVPGVGATAGTFQILSALHLAPLVPGETGATQGTLRVSWEAVPGASGYHAYLDEGLADAYDAYTEGTSVDAPLPAAGSVRVIAYGQSATVDAIDAAANAEILTELIPASQATLRAMSPSNAAPSPDESYVLQVRGRFTP